MDAKKVEALKNAGYRIQQGCGVCLYSRGFLAGAVWSTCQKIPYTHEKHTGEPREASVHLFGICDHFEPKVPPAWALGDYEIFLRP